MNCMIFNVEGNKLTVTSDISTTQGSVNYDSCEFNFDAEWNSFTKTAVFAVGSRKAYRVELDENNRCNIPAPCLENEGVLRIGVYGENGDIVIATNSIAHKVNDGIDGLVEWLEEDTSLVLNAIDLLREEASNFKQELSDRFDSLLDRLGSMGTEALGVGISDYPDDWFIPNPVTNAVDYPGATKGDSYETILNFKLNPLYNEFPEYVSRDVIGMDATNTYPIYAYSFTPVHYEKTVLITSCVHGTERNSMHCAVDLLDAICRNHNMDRSLNYLRTRVKIVFVPAVNPYGLMNSKNTNGNNVNIGLNFSHKWSECDIDKKGSAAEDQAETQCIVELLDSLSNDKLCAVMDLHTTAAILTGRGAYYPRDSKGSVTALADTVYFFNYSQTQTGIDDAVLMPSNNPTLSNYAAKSLDVNACELLWTNSMYGGTNNNNCITRYTEFIGNMLIALVKNSRTSLKPPHDAFVNCVSWRSSSSSDKHTVTSTSAYQNVGISACEMRLRFPGVVTLDGYVTLEVSQNCKVWINPVLYQVHSPEQEYNDRLNCGLFDHEINLTSGTHVVPISSVLNGYYTSKNASSECYFCEEVCAVLAMKSSVASVVSVTGFSMRLSVIPTDTSRPVEITSPMGLATDYTATSVPTQELKYPTGEYTGVDSLFND